MTKPVKFEEPHVSCQQEGEIPFGRLDNETNAFNLENETCEIVNCIQCLPVTENICKEIKVVKTYQEIVENCNPVENRVPRQDFEHIEKCFFNQNPTTGGMYNSAESTKQMEEKLNFQVPAEGLELVILLHTQY